MFHMNSNRHVGVLLRLGGMTLGHLRLVRGSLVITGPIGILRCAVMLRGTLVMVRGLAVMFCWIIRHCFLGNCFVRLGSRERRDGTARDLVVRYLLSDPSSNSFTNRSDSPCA